MAGPHLNAVGIVVTEMARSVAFYRRLGVEFGTDAGSEVHAEADLGGGVRLMLDTEEVIRSFNAGWQPGGTGRASLAVGLSSAAEVDVLYASLAADGYGHLEPWDAFWGQRYALAVDPDGTEVGLYAPLSSPPEN